MKKYSSLLIFLFSSVLSIAQNVGIGTSSPGFPLNFSNALGDKISLYGNSGNHYGFGIQGGLFQMYSDAAAANISFGYGSSAAFTERMRIINSGADALLVNGRIAMRNGTFPNNPAQGPGIWFYTPDNLGPLLGFIGVQNNQNMGFYGGPAGWGFTYDAINSRVGIGNQNPNAPLSFPPSLGKKITLYPGATGDVGIGVSGNRLYLYADNPNADVAFGWDAAGVFNERFAVKPTGALAVNGVMGQSGQFLSSNGSSAAATWKTFFMTDYMSTIETNNGIINLTGTTPIEMPDATMTINLSRPAKVILYIRASLRKDCGVGSCFTKARMIIRLNGTSVASYDINGANYGAEWPNSFTTHSCGPEIYDLSAGTHTFTFAGLNIFNDAIFSGGAKAIVIYNN